MKHNVTAPSVGESITEVSVLKWAKQDGQAVKSGDLLLEIESDKATVEIVAENAGVLQILKQPGERVAIGTVIGVIDDAGTPSAAASAPAPEKKASGATAAGPATMAPAQTPSGGQSAMAGSLSPSAQRVAADRGVDPSQIQGTGRGGRVTKADAMQAPLSAPAPGATTSFAPQSPMSIPPRVKQDAPGDRRVPMSLLRQKIAERLVHAQHTAAILTTFNEVDMSAVMQLRAQHKESFKAKHGVNLSFMSFFTRACVEALKMIPEVNATIDGKDIVYHDYCDIGIAVGTERGLVVPILRGAHDFGFVDIERKIGEFAVKARDGKLSIADMSGGTFTISNGGTYGSLMSTPILNPPQSGILGMHKIMDRPMAVNGKVEIRPMMYIALSYDHRIIDGKGAVGFLVAVKDFIENPAKLNLNF